MMCKKEFNNHLELVCQKLGNSLSLLFIFFPCLTIVTNFYICLVVLENSHYNSCLVFVYFGGKV